MNSELLNLAGLQSSIATTVIITVIILVLYHVFFMVLKKWTNKRQTFVPEILQRNLYLPGLFIILILSFNIAFPFFNRYIHSALFAVLKQILVILLISCVAFLLIRLFSVFREVIIQNYRRKELKDFSYRSARTKYGLLQQVVNVVVIVLAVVFILLTFDAIKRLSTGILASAGVVGIIIGFAAQKSLGTLFSGITIAVAEPIRLDDVVVVEKEFGTIAEINLTYVVVKLWDERNLIVPINYFLEKTFESWTRISPEIIGKVKIFTDYTVPMDELRKQFDNWTEETPLWDKKVRALQVTDATDTSIEIRAIMSARNPSECWDLQCFIREKLIDYIQQNYPDALPRTRFTTLPFSPLKA